MSEEISNPAASVVEAGTETATNQITTSPEEVETFIKNKKSLGRDRVGEALQQAHEGPTPPTPETMTMEQLQETEIGQGGHKGIDYNRVIQSLPDEAQKLLANLRADYTRKTQEIAQQKKEMEALKQTMTSETFMNNLQEKAGTENVELDPYDTDSFNKRIEQEVARRLQDMLNPIREEQAVMRKRAQLERFKSENPDLMEYKTEVKELLVNNGSLSLEDAYYIAKGQALSKENKKLKTELDARQARMREVGLKLSGAGAREQKQIPKHLKSAHQIYAWLKNNGK
jgi:FtsZ-binding cell division protein ZapB